MPPSKKIHALVELTRSYNFTSVLLIFSIGFYFSQPQNIGMLFYGLLVLVLFYAAANVQNDIEDRHIDKENNMQRPLEKTVTLAEARTLLIGLLSAGFGVSLFHLSVNSIFVPLLLALIWLYNAKPFYLSRKPFPSFLTLGTISTLFPLVYGFVLGGHEWTMTAVLWIVSWFLLRISITLLKDYKDETGDRMFNKRTFLIAYGKKATALTSFVLAIFGYVGLFAMSLSLKTTDFWLVIPLLFAWISFGPRIGLLKIHDNQQSNRIFHAILVKENRFELVYLVWIIFSR